MPSTMGRTHIALGELRVMDGMSINAMKGMAYG